MTDQDSIPIIDQGAAALPYLCFGEHDPTVVPTNGMPGVLYIRISQRKNGVFGPVGLFQKITTAGQDTNWQAVGSGGGGGGGLLQNVYFVTKNGNDATADGSITKPYLTVQAAINAASLVATPTVRPCVYVMPGTYVENCVLKANVFVRGLGYNSSRILGTWSIDNTFTPAGDHRSGWADVGLFTPGTTVIDFQAVSSNEGKIYAWNVRFGGAVTVTSFSSINQFIMFGCEFFTTVTLNGMNSQLNNCVMQNLGTVVCNHKAGSTNALLTSGGSLYNVSINGSLGAFNAYLGHNVQDGGQLTLTGVNANAYATANSIPRRSLVNFAGGATDAQLSRVNDAFALGFNPSIPANYPVGTNTVQKALDAINALGGSYSEGVEYRTITAPEAAAKQLTLAASTSVPAKVMLFSINGPAQELGVDYAVIGANVIDWNGLGLDGVLSAGDKILINYPL